MADTITNVKTVDIQLLDADRSNATTIKLDNPKNNLTREQVSAAMQPALSAGWFLTNKGSVAMYLGDITINQSIKTKLSGQDFYVTPSSLNFYNTEEGDTYSSLDINVSGATIQGYNIIDVETDPGYTVSVDISNNGLKATVHLNDANPQRATSFKVILIIQGTSITVPCTVPIS